MPRGPTLRKADLDRVLKALADAGQGIARIEVRPGGAVVITPLTLNGTTPQVSELDTFRDRKRAAGAT